MEYDVKSKNLTRQEKGFPQTIPQLIQKYKLDALWENIEKLIKDIIQQELGQKAIKGTSLTIKGIEGKEGFIQVLDSEEKPVVEINNKGVEVGEGKTIIEGGNEINKSIKWEDILEKPNLFTPDDFIIVSGEINGGNVLSTGISFEYPEGFNKDNCIVISVMARTKEDIKNWHTVIGPCSFSDLLGNSVCIDLSNSGMNAELIRTIPTAQSIEFKVLLMKIDKIKSKWVTG